MVDQLAIAAAGWGTIMALSPILQIRRIVIRRSSADVSLAYLAVLQLGFGLWVAYGLALGNPVLVVPNFLASVVGAVTIFVAARNRRPRRGTEQVATGSDVGERPGD
jgi:MtN3 and saliva related transmembrane protein